MLSSKKLRERSRKRKVLGCGLCLPKQLPLSLPMRLLAFLLFCLHPAEDGSVQEARVGEYTGRDQPITDFKWVDTDIACKYTHTHIHKWDGVEFHLLNIFFAMNGL